MKKPLNEICCHMVARQEGYTDEEIYREFSPSACEACQEKRQKEALRERGKAVLGNAWQPAEETKPSAMDEAVKVVNGDRQEDYGDAKESFERIAALWSPLLGTPVTAKQVALCMIALKLSRATTSDKHDTVVDIIGYGMCLEKIMEVKKP